MSRATAIVAVVGLTVLGAAAWILWESVRAVVIFAYALAVVFAGGAS